MSQDAWTTVDAYLAERLIGPDPVLDAVLAANAEAGLPAIDVSPLQGRMLNLFAQMCGARRILEVGTLGGYSSIWLARALPPGGMLVTLEVNERHAAVARENFARAGVADRIELVVGPAAESLPKLVAGGAGPFDLVFIDADKPGNPTYLAHALTLSRPGTVIVCDNVVRDGRVADPASRDASVLGVRAALDLVSAERRLAATAVQTVGTKGWDGFMMAVVQPVD